ncbi:MAG: hypothetical protein N3A61_06455 [Ignavibacteria bacterium]|nr:hypothetical protein [Ignavibacteria bacterium]
MPIKKFKTFEEATLDNVTPYPDEHYYDQMRKFLNIYYELYIKRKKKHFRGIMKFKDFESFNKFKEEFG